MISSPSGGGSIVHLRTGDELELSAEHAKLLERATLGLDAMDPWLTEVVERYRALGLLVPASFAAAPAEAPIAAAPAPPAPSAMSAASPEHPVPCLRPSLKLTPTAGSSLVSVSDPSTGKSFQLYDFEVSLAQLLDGGRTHAQVVAAARTLGLPVTFESLVRFIRELERYGFLSAPGTVSAGREDPSSTWQARESWDAATRALYESGVRMHRQGRYHESAAYFEAMLVQDPKNDEALEMLHQARQRAGEPPAQQLPPLPEGGDKRLEQFDELSLDDAPVPASAVAVAPAAPRAAPREAPRASSRLRTLLLASVGLAALAGLAWSVLIPMIQRPVVAPPPVVAPSPEVVVVAAEVDAGAQLLAAGEPDAGVEVAPADAGAAQSVAIAAADAGADVQVELADEGVARAWQTFAISKKGRVKMGEILAPADGNVSWKVPAEQRVKRGELVAVMGENRLVAPVQGLVLRAIADGQPAGAGQRVADILYHEAYLQAVVTGAKPEASWACEVFDEAAGQRAACTVNTVVPRGAGYFVTAILLPRWFDAAVDPKLRLAPP